MSKSTVKRPFVGLVIAFVGGVALLAAGLVVAYANGAFSCGCRDRS